MANATLVPSHWAAILSQSREIVLRLVEHVVRVAQLVAEVVLLSEKVFAGISLGVQFSS